jgi:sec-independent protein translocase protein TatB
VLDLSPTKLIIIFIVVIVLLGPKRLPQVARQLGAGWRKLTGFQQQIEHEIRQTLPDLPSSQDIVRFARSPVTMLNQLAQMPNGSGLGDTLVEDPGAPPAGGAAAERAQVAHVQTDYAAGPTADGSAAASNGKSGGAGQEPHRPEAGPGTHGPGAASPGGADVAMLAALADDPTMN